MPKIHSSPHIAALLAFSIPLLALIGAYGSEYLGGLHPCHLCLEQRWPHFVAIAFGAMALISGPASLMGRGLIAIAASAIATSGAIGIFHVGVEMGLWEYVSPCTSGLSGEGSAIDKIMTAPLIRCDEVAFRFLGISMAGWNAIVSIASALTIISLIFKERYKTAA